MEPRGIEPIRQMVLAGPVQFSPADIALILAALAAAWACCFGVARARRRPGPAGPARRGAGSAPEGWGR